MSHYTVFSCDILLKSQPGDDTIVYVKSRSYQALVGIVKRFIGRKKIQIDQSSVCLYPGVSPRVLDERLRLSCES